MTNPVTHPADHRLIADAELDARSRVAWIPIPRTIEETGLSPSLLEELALKTIGREREVNTRILGEILALSPQVIDEIFQRLRKGQLLEVTGMTGSLYRMSLSSAGRARAEELMSANQYVGPAPVSLTAYSERVRGQGISGIRVRPHRVRDAFASLVLDGDTVRQIGIAIGSGAPLMLFGPSGTGKTSVAERIPQVFDDGVFVPHAIEVNGEVITVFDRGVHRPLPPAAPNDHDRRWVYCERPFVMAGGELTAEMLDLQSNPVSGFYTAPPQVKANTGVFVIDDFGRQRMRPEELLNRWIVPLERGVDFLTLHGGGKFAVPFAVLIVFATNLDPRGGGAVDAGSTVTDAVFLRRIPNKVLVGNASPEQFHEIFRRACAGTNLTYNAALVERVIEFLGTHVREPLRPCVPRDLIRQIVWEAQYDGGVPVLDGKAIARACRTYFALSAPAAEAVAASTAGVPEVGPG